ncbi:unnamed protein product [Rotaria sp. Silwood2]|nr:unnamed protein product [Rotaria sp. Silwood2]
MGRKYYCDYCDKRLPAGLNHRKNHNRGIQHINNKRTYYLQFQGFNDLFLIFLKKKQIIIKIFDLDLVEILLNERTKKICNKWNQSNSCPFGDNCKYSHRSNYELIQLIEQEKQNLNNQLNFDVHRWVQKKLPNEILLPESLTS